MKLTVLSETLDTAMPEAGPTPEHQLLGSGSSLYPPNLSWAWAFVAEDLQQWGMDKVIGDPVAVPVILMKGINLGFLKGMTCGSSSKISQLSPSTGAQGHWKKWCVCKASDMCQGRVYVGLERS